MNAIILAALLRAWADELTTELQRLDKTLPIERRYRIDHIRKSVPVERQSTEMFGDLFKINIKQAWTLKPYDPDLFDEVKIPLPHDELINLATFSNKLIDMAEQLEALASSRSISPDNSPLFARIKEEE